jgi:hypothetical protein
MLAICSEEREEHPSATSDEDAPKQKSPGASRQTKYFHSVIRKTKERQQMMM